MATRFVELNEAAKTLGLTPEQLVEMRSNGDIHGYRDGSSWKFKAEEIERVAGELGAKPAASNEGTIPFENGLDALSDMPKDGESGSVLVSEEELGHSGESTSSTIIGKADAEAQADSDLKLSTGSDDSLGELAVDGSVDSDVTLIPGVGTDSDVSLVPDPGSDRDMSEQPDSNLELQSGSTGGTGRLEALDSDMSIGSSDLDVSLDSELALSDDDEVVLGGSGIGSDLTLGSADSGINLASPSDSGLSLEADSGINLQSPTDSGLSLEDEPLDLAGSSISSLELPEDEEVVDLEDKPQAAQPAQEEPFQLAPSEDMFGDESDSGSQVIALEESGAFEGDATGVLEPSQALLEETTGLEQQLDSMGTTGAIPGAQPVAAGFVAAEFPEAPYSVWNVIGLLLIVLFLSLSGILMTDIVQNMWAWEEARDVSTGLSDGITSAIFGK